MSYYFRTFKIKFILFNLVLSSVFLYKGKLRADDLQETERIFHTLCSTCHGKDGGGISDEDVQKLGLDKAPANFRDVQFSSREPKYVWKRVIRDGGERHGYSRYMPSFGNVLSEAQIDQIVRYIKGLGYDPSYPQGELNFTRAIFTAKAFPEDEFIYIGNYTKSKLVSYKQTFYFAKRIGNVYQVEFKNSFIHSSDFSGEFETGVKWNFLHLEHNLIISSFGFEVAIPYMSDEKWVYAPYLAFGKGFGNRFSFQISSKLMHSLVSKEIKLNLSSAFHFIPTVEVGRTIIPALEFLADYSPKEDYLVPYLVPQLYFSISKRGHLALNIGFKQPLRTSDEKFSVVGFLLWEYIDGWFFEGL
ncbi:MAG: cytochrome c [Candidatus Calescibacterium sp.]|nr:cytochrome c [Candidatus Calescibacterium sp.]MCX7734008.1 cytochrome c [bacterium]MDW8086393.1 cytochrome c [Candidatus Calescibacterium sp.]